MKAIINKVIGRRYYVLGQLGKGGSSNVYKVKDIENEKVFALKKYITSDPANQKNTFENIQNELKVLKYVSHPVLPKIYDVIKEEDSFFLVMEHVDGIDLREYIKFNGPLKKMQIASIMEQVCSGLYYLYSLEKPIIYRDLKPSNIIMMADGRIKLIDFGIAKRYSKEIDADFYAYGSKGFAAPEQFGDKKGRGIFNTDIRADIYGIGTTMYYLRTGKCYKRDSKNWKVNGKLKQIINKCTQNNPDKRYQNCIEVLCEINKL